MNYKTSGILFIVAGILFFGVAWIGENRVLYVVGITFMVLGIAFLIMPTKIDVSKDKDTKR
jgi:uncharacterized membrane protein HdeD (DUF308 family)